jgi:FAD:protein FMN transferase
MGAWRALYFEFTAMASPCSVRIETRDERRASSAARAAIEEVRRIEQKYSRYRTSSVVSKINHAAGKATVTVDTETMDLLRFADQLYQLSDGLFDATSGVLRQAWDFKYQQVPSPETLRQTLAHIGWADVLLKGGQCRLPRAGMELDFGGFGKEYAADRAAGVLKQGGVEHALVNLGGDIHALGAHGMPDSAGLPWTVQVQHPRQAQATLANVKLPAGGMATSGDYERYFENAGQRYCHVLNPLTGWPVTYWRSITVVAANTTTAGAISTTAMLKAEQGLAWLEAQKVAYLAVDHHGTVFDNLFVAL